MEKTITTKEAPAIIRAFLERGIRFALLGSPGIGKTSLVGQIARALSHHLLISKPMNWNEATVTGIPFPNRDTKQAEFYPFADIAAVLHATEPTIWFIDDLGQCPSHLQPLMMEILDGKINGTPIPSCVKMCFASNRMADGAGVNAVLTALTSRVDCLLTLVPELDSWCDWAWDEGLNPIGINFVRARPEALTGFERHSDLVTFSCGRTLEKLFKRGGIYEAWQAMGEPDDVRTQLFTGTIGPRWGMEFNLYLDMFSTVYPMADAVFTDYASAIIPQDEALFYPLVTTLAVRATRHNFDAIGGFAQRLWDAGHREHAVCLLVSTQRACPDVVYAGTPYTMVQSGPIGQALSGKYV